VSLEGKNDARRAWLEMTMANSKRLFTCYLSRDGNATIILGTFYYLTCYFFSYIDYRLIRIT
jgi:hypothetical protein